MKYLLDTNVVSEFASAIGQPVSLPPVSDSARSRTVFISVLNWGNCGGVERVSRRDPHSAGARRADDVGPGSLSMWIRYGGSMGRLGAPIRLPDVDCLLAAPPLVHGMTVVTRNCPFTWRQPGALHC